jgi:drug/metabolite transporter (DMT)-like permease
MTLVRRQRVAQSGLAPHLALAACILIWSANATVLKVGLEHVRVVPFTAARFLIGGAVLLAISSLGARAVPRPPRATLLVPAALLGVVINQLAFAGGLSITTAVDVSLIQGLAPLFTALVLVGWTRAQVPAVQWVALALGLVGTLAVVATAGAGRGGASLAGDVIAVGAPLSWAFYLVLIDRDGGRTPAGQLAPWSLLLGAAIMIPLAVFAGGPGRDDWLPALPSLLYSALLATALTWTLYFWALPRVGVTGTAIYTYLQPALGAFFGAAFLKEAVGYGQLAGAVLILLAAYLGTWRQALRRPRPV